MALAITIGGVDVLDYLHLGEGNPAIEWGLQARTVARMTLHDRAGVYRPAMRAEVLIDVEGTRVFGGVVQHITEGDFGDYVGNYFTVEASDWTVTLETVLLNGILVGSTLKDLVEAVVAVVASRGFTVHPSQADGPVIGSLGYAFQYLNNILDDLARISGWPWTVDADQQVLFAPADGRPAPFAFEADNDTIHTISTVHDVNGYVNAVWLQYGMPGPRDVTESYVGDGTTRDFPARAFAPASNLSAFPPTVLVNGTVTETVGPDGDATTSWWWHPGDPFTDTAASMETATSRATLGVGETLSWIEAATFPGAVFAFNTAEITAYGEFAIIVTEPDIVDVAQAQAAADAVLRERGGLLRRIVVTTPRTDLFPGHVVDVDVSERAIDEACLVVSSRLRFAGRRMDTEEDLWRVEHELVEGDDYAESWQKFFKDFQQGGVGGSSPSGVVSPTPTGVGGKTIVPLGGSRTVSQMTQGEWVPIVNFTDVLLNAADGATRIVRGHSWVLEAGMDINVRVIALDAPTYTVVGTGTVKTATDQFVNAAFQEFAITLIGHNYYRMEMLVSAGGDGWVAGMMLHPA